VLFVGDIGATDAHVLNANLFKYLPSEIQHEQVSIISSAIWRLFWPTLGLSLVKPLLSKLERFKPDIVLFDRASFLCLCPKIHSFFQRNHVRLIVSIRGDAWLETFAYYRDQSFPANALLPVGLSSIKAGLQVADRILANCRWLERVVVNRFPRKNTGVLYRGIDVDPWLVRDNSRYNFARPAVGLLQSHEIRQKVEGVLKFSDVVREMRDVNFYIAGGGRYLPLVRKEYSDLPNAHVIGRLKYPEEVRRFYQSVDVYVAATGLDAGPKTVLEALLCGRPIIASRICGVPERVVEGITGFTVPNGAVDRWVEKIRLLLQDEKLRTSMVEKGREHVMQHFNLKTTASSLASFLTETVNKH